MTEEEEEYERLRREALMEQLDEIYGEPVLFPEEEEINLDPEPSEPSATVSNILKLTRIRAKDFVAIEYPPVKWIVDNLFAAQEAVSMIVGESGSFKTWVAIHLARCVASGEDFFGFAVPQSRKVLYFNLEMPDPLLQERAIGFGISEENIEFINSASRPIDLMKPDDFAEAAGQVAEAKPGLIIFDTLSKLHTSSAGESDNDKMTELILAARRLGEVGRCLVIILHHTSKYNPEFPKPKLERIRGASAIRDNMLNILFLSVKKSKDSSLHVEAELIKSWSGETGITFARKLLVDKSVLTGKITKAEWVEYLEEEDEDSAVMEIMARLREFFSVGLDGFDMTTFKGIQKSKKNPSASGLFYEAFSSAGKILARLEEEGVVKIEKEKTLHGRTLIYKGPMWGVGGV